MFDTIHSKLHHSKPQYFYQKFHIILKKRRFGNYHMGLPDFHKKIKFQKHQKIVIGEIVESEILVLILYKLKYDVGWFLDCGNLERI